MPNPYDIAQPNMRTGVTPQGNNFAMGAGATDPGFQYNMPSQDVWSSHQNKLAGMADARANSYAGRPGPEAAFFRQYAQGFRDMANRQLPTRDEAFASYQNRPTSPTFGMPYANGSQRTSPMTGLTGGGQQPMMQQQNRQPGYNQGMVPPGATMGSSQQMQPAQMQAIQQHLARIMAAQQAQQTMGQGINMSGFNTPANYGQPRVAQQAPGFQFSPLQGLY